MITPDTLHAKDGTEIPFVARWSCLVSALIVEPSVKLIALTAGNYRIYDGAGVFPSQQRVARQTSYDAETTRKAWAVLRAVDMAERDIPSYYDGRRRTADEYTLLIPESWRQLPVYGPGMKRFHCQHCGKVFNPQPGTHLRRDGTVGWWLARMVFCPQPGRPKRTIAEVRKKAPLKHQPPGCFAEWGGHDRWADLKEEAWEMFRKARDDDWPSAADVRRADPWRDK